MVYKKTTDINNIVKIIGMIFIFVCLIAVLFTTMNNQSGAVITNETGPFSIRLIATQNFGKSTIFSKEIIIEPGETAMDALKKNLDVKCSYTDGYVESINDIKSTYSGANGEKNDWFYYVNGMLSAIGASDYTLNPGDKERWDFHSWDSDRMTTAIIADYPEPFVNGFNGKIRDTVIVYSEEFYNVAVALQQSLEQNGVSSSINLFSNLSNNEKMNNNLILVDMYDNELIKELNTNAQTLGFFIEFDKGQIKTFDETGKEKQVFQNGGAVLATQNPWNPKGNWNGENVVWVITGITIKDVTNAADTLINNNEDIKNAASIVVSNGKIYRVP